ncbi:MAG TPA: hypothetical protein GXZ43_04245 [Clostridiaceae bacterium]|nr:hypothetical protein [Clostridiaceae bacterium]
MNSFRFKEKRKTGKYILLAIVLLAIVISLFIIVRYNKQLEYENSFESYLDQGKYQEALELYREVQNSATSNNITAEEKERYRNLQASYEKIVESKVNQIFERLKLGDSLSSDDSRFISSLEEITAAVVSPILNRETEAWLDQKIDYDHWKHTLKSFQNFPNLKVNVDNLLNQEENLKLAAQEFAAATDISNINDWNLAWKKWQEIANNPDLGRFAQDYAGYRLKIFQEEIYRDLIEIADRHISGERYYSAKQILDRLFDAFPDQPEIIDKLQICNDKLQNRIVVWEKNVEHIAVRPLTLDTERAKLGPYKTFAETGLLTPKEFENLLNELYLHDYVLITGETYMNYPENYPQVLIPAGKKPLVLIFDQYQYSTQYRESGSAEQLAYDSETNKFVSRLSADKPETEVENQDCISILENFIAEHSDFSFNGAKARIALTVNENILGYTINEEQTQNIIQKKAELGLEDYILTDKTDEEKNKFYQLQSNDLEIVISALKEHGFTFCNGTYSGDDLGFLSLADLEQNIEQWNATTKHYLGEVPCLVFPGGSHVYNDEEKFQYLLNSGYCTFYGEGPNTYNFYGNAYIHFDFTSINGFTLVNAEQWNLDRFITENSVLEDWRD